MSNEISIINAAELSTIDKKGNRVSFERSLAFASKDARLELAASVYARQVAGGTFGPIIRDALAAGVLTKSQCEIVTAMLGSNRNPTKDTAGAVCAVVLAAWASKTPKGQKAFYVAAIRDLHRAIAVAPVGAVVATA